MPVASAPGVVVTESSPVSFVSEVVAVAAVVRPFGARNFLLDGILAIFEVELVDGLAFALLLAHQHSVKMCDFPQFWVHLFARAEDQFELGEELLVLIAVLLIVL